MRIDEVQIRERCHGECYEALQIINSMRELQRKRSPTEKPKDGEVVLTVSKNGILNLWTWYGRWTGTGSLLDGWFRISHLIGEGSSES